LGFWCILAIGITLAVEIFAASQAVAQTPAFLDEAGRLEEINVRIKNPSSDTALNDRLVDRVRVGLGVFPGDQFSRTAAELNLSRIRRGSAILKTELVVVPGPTGGLSVTVLVTLGSATAGDEGRGALITGTSSDLPVLYDKDGTFVRMRLEGIAMYYGNNNAWYGQPGQCFPEIRSSRVRRLVPDTAIGRKDSYILGFPVSHLCPRICMSTAALAASTVDQPDRSCLRMKRADIGG
jgi:hypothetical protein